MEEERELTEEEGIAIGKSIELDSKAYFANTIKKVINRESGKPIDEIKIEDFAFNSNGLCPSCVFDIATCQNVDTREHEATQVWVCHYYEKRTKKT